MSQAVTAEKALQDILQVIKSVGGPEIGPDEGLVDAGFGSMEIFSLIEGLEHIYGEFDVDGDVLFDSTPRSLAKEIVRLCGSKDGPVPGPAPAAPSVAPVPESPGPSAPPFPPTTRIPAPQQPAPAPQLQLQPPPPAPAVAHVQASPPVAQPVPTPVQPPAAGPSAPAQVQPVPPPAYPPQYPPPQMPMQSPYPQPYAYPYPYPPLQYPAAPYPYPPPPAPYPYAAPPAPYPYLPMVPQYPYQAPPYPYAQPPYMPVPQPTPPLVDTAAAPCPVAPAPQSVTPSAPAVAFQPQAPAAQAPTPTPAATRQAPKTQVAEQKKPEEAKAAPQAVNSVAVFMPDTSQSTAKGGLTPHVKEVLDLYVSRTPKSKACIQKNRDCWADNRNATGFRMPWKEACYQLVVDRAQGGVLWDLDGNKYVDIAGSFGANFLGHSHPAVVNAVTEQLMKGFPLGMQNEMAGECAKLIAEFTGNERTAFMNSGTEAILMAIRLGRVATKKNTIVTFTGSYHGWADSVMVRMQNDGKTVPLAAGMLNEATVNLAHDSLESLNWIKANASHVGVVIIEPIQSRRADLHPRVFLKALRKITEENNIALVFDEVVTGFRLHQGGAQQYWDIRADIVTYGKACGGGFPIGVVSGKAKFLDAIDGGTWKFGDESMPRVTVTFFAGTFCKHPITMAACLGALRYMKEQGKQLQAHCNLKTERMCATLNDWLRSVGAPMRMAAGGSLFKFHFKLASMELLWYHLYNRGVFTWEGRTCYLCVQHTAEDIQHIINAVKDSIQSMMAAGYINPTFEPDDVFIQPHETVTPEEAGIVDDGFVDNKCTRHFLANADLTADPFTPPVPKLMGALSFPMSR